MYIYNVGKWIKQYQRRNGLAGVASKHNVVLSYEDVTWSSLELVDDKSYPMNGMKGCEFSTEIGTEVEITSGRLKGLVRKLSLSLEDLPWFVRNLLPADTIDINLANRETFNIDDYIFTASEKTLARNRFATFECEVELEGYVLFYTSIYGGSQQSTDEVDIREIVRNTSWTVEGECTFHLGLNDSLEWI